MTVTDWGIVTIALLSPIGAVLWLRPPPARRNMNRVRMLAQQNGFRVRVLREQDATKRFGNVDGQILVEYTLPREPDAPAITPFKWSRNASSSAAESVKTTPQIVAQFGLESTIYSLSLAPGHMSLVWTEKMQRQDVEAFLQSLLALANR